MHFPQRITSMHSKVRQIHSQLQQPHSANAAAVDPEAAVTSGTVRMGWTQRIRAKWTAATGIGFQCCAHRQVFYAQCVKLVSLFAVAIAHLLFLHPFLELFSQLEQYAAPLEDFVAPLRHSIHDLGDYKKNVWMTVAVLCIGLSTSSFFLFLLPSSSPIRKRYIYLVGLIDLVSFGSLPALFLSRVAIIQRVRVELGAALEQAHRTRSAEKLMNAIQCTIQPREKLPFCSELILRAVFPADLLKFLLVLCAFALAYLALAYLIYWCIKHWIPHSAKTQFLPAGSRLCPCCAGLRSGKGRRYSPLGRFSGSCASVPKFFAPPPLIMPNPLAIPSEQCSPVQQQQPDEPVPTEPKPSHLSNN